MKVRLLLLIFVLSTFAPAYSQAAGEAEDFVCSPEFARAVDCIHNNCPSLSYASQVVGQDCKLISVDDFCDCIDAYLARAQNSAGICNAVPCSVEPTPEASPPVTPTVEPNPAAAPTVSPRIPALAQGGGCSLATYGNEVNGLPMLLAFLTPLFWSITQRKK